MAAAGQSYRLILSTFVTILINNCMSASFNLTTTTIIPETNNNRSEPGVVTIYTLDNFLGIPWKITVSNCTDIPVLFYKKASSIDTHDNCVILFTRQECVGRNVRIAPGTSGHSNLSDVNFDNDLASLKLCDQNTPSNSSDSRNLKEYDNRSKREIRNTFLAELMSRLGILNEVNYNAPDSEDAGFGNNVASNYGEDDESEGEIFNLQSLLKFFRM